MKSTFDIILRKATQSIEEKYFLLSRYEGETVYRERVYCYELYHQMRLLWPHDCPYCINGELDKVGHTYLRSLGVGSNKPDFLIHQPGVWKNYAIVEVKPATSVNKYKKDIETLNAFVKNMGYERAILLFYGIMDKAQIESKVEYIRKYASSIKNNVQIELWFHFQVGKPAKHVVTFLDHQNGIRISSSS